MTVDRALAQLVGSRHAWKMLRARMITVNRGTACANGVERSLGSLNDVKSVRRFDEVTDGSYFELECGVGKRLDHRASFKNAKIASSFGGPGFVRAFRNDSFPRCARA